MEIVCVCGRAWYNTAGVVVVICTQRPSRLECAFFCIYARSIRVMKYIIKSHKCDLSCAVGTTMKSVRYMARVQERRDAYTIAYIKSRTHSLSAISLHVGCEEKL